MFGWYMPIINRIPVHHIAQLVNMLKPTLHFPIEDARSVSWNGHGNKKGELHQYKESDRNTSQANDRFENPWFVI